MSLCLGGKGLTGFQVLKMSQVVPSRRSSQFNGDGTSGGAWKNNVRGKRVSMRLVRLALVNLFQHFCERERLQEIEEVLLGFL